MSQCVFQSLHMLSMTEGKAREILFDPVMTVIRGKNDTGKSSLMKAIYETFAASPAQIHPKWKAANVRALIKFTLDGASYAILKSGDRFSIFDRNDDLLITTARVTEELAPFIAQLFGFNLQLQARGDAPTQATPSFLFLPFYFDQDASWTKNWSGFKRLGQFERWRSDLVDYHLGVRPDAYYTAKANAARLRGELRNVQQRREVLESVSATFSRQLVTTTFNISLDAYHQQIEQLLVACNQLKWKEERLKTDLMRHHNQMALIENQLAIVRAAAKELEDDYTFAVSEIGDSQVECPTCGTKHENSFSARFSIARDQFRCVELEEQLRDELTVHQRLVTAISRRYALAATELETIQELLDRRQNDVTLRQLIQNEGKQEARDLIESEIQNVRALLLNQTIDLNKLEAQMARYDDPQRRENIRRDYLVRMRRFLAFLDVKNLPEEKYRELESQVQETGSDLPRALLAYYFAILHGIRRNPDAIFCPIVIDSPRQQDQDPGNWLRMLEFIRDNRPSDSQVVLSLVDQEGVELGGKVVELDQVNSVLSKDEYKQVMETMGPYFEKSSRSGLFS